jgi:hypothetical protein
MGAIGGVVVALLIRDQSQRRRQIQHGLGQRGLQEQTHLSDAEWQGGVRVQVGHLIWGGQGTRRRGAQEPPLSGSGAVGSEPGSDEPELPKSYDGASRARSAAHTGPCPVPPCTRQNRFRSASASRSPAQTWKAVSRWEHCSHKISIPAPLPNR